MSKAGAVRAHDIVYAGALGPIMATSGRLTNAASAQFGTVLVFPCDMYIHEIHYYIDTQFTHASSKLNLGNLLDDDAYIDGILLQNVATGYYVADASLLPGVSGRRIPKGTPFAFSLDAADTTGKITATAVLASYSPT